MTDDPLQSLDDRLNAIRDSSTLLRHESKKATAPSSQKGGGRAGSELVGGVLGGLLLGWAFDSTFQTRPLGLFIGLFLGTIAGFYGLYRALKS